MPSPADLLITLEKAVHDCYLCPIAYNVKNRVIYRGTVPAPVLFVGEAPGAQENIQGRPFVGRSGQLLDKAIATPEVGLGPELYCIVNVLKCWPGEKNPDPTPAQIKNCRPFLDLFIRIANPRVIVTLGRYAAQVLASRQQSLARLRQMSLVYGDVPVISTYHPSFLLRHGNTEEGRKYKQEFWDDLQRAAALVKKPSIEDTSIPEGCSPTDLV